MSIIGWLILGLIAGFVASKIVDSSGQGSRLGASGKPGAVQLSAAAHMALA